MPIGEYRPHTWNIPGEYGGFWDATELNFQSLKQGIQEKEISRIYNSTNLDWYDAVATVQGWIDGWKNKLRYNIITFSNFITLPEQVPILKSMLVSAYRSLRHGGIIVLVGGTGDKYEHIYSEVQGLLRVEARGQLVTYESTIS